MVIQEVYIGRIKEIDEMLNQISIIRDNWSTDSNSVKIKKLSKLESMIEEFFGFKAFSIRVMSNKGVDAYTMAISNAINVDPDKMIETTSKGYRFTKESKTASLMYVSEGLMSNPSISNEEVMGVILHEIGHNFVQRSPLVRSLYKSYKSSCISGIIISTLLMIVPAYWVYLPNLLKSYKWSFKFNRLFIAKFRQLKNKIPILKNITVDKIFGEFKDRRYAKRYEKNSDKINFQAPYIKRDIEKEKKRQIDANGEYIHARAYDRSVERLSDDFANIYGFGLYLATGLLKIDNSDSASKRIRDLHKGHSKRTYDKADALFAEIDGILGEHPGSVDRILSLIESLEFEIKNNKDLTPKLRKEVQDNLNLLKEVQKDIKKKSGPMKDNKNEYLTALYALQMGEGSTEDSAEKRYFNREEINQDFEDRKIEEAFLLEEFDDFDEKFWVED